MCVDVYVKELNSIKIIDSNDKICQIKKKSIMVRDKKKNLVIILDLYLSNEKHQLHSFFHIGSNLRLTRRCIRKCSYELFWGARSNNSSAYKQPYDP